MSWLLIKLAIRFVVFAGVFWFATYKNPKIKVQPKVALPLVGLVFALLNTALYWLFKPILNLATLWMLWFLIPLVVNGLLLYATDKLLKPLRIEGILPMLWLAGLLTGAHGLLWFGLEYVAR